MSAAVSRRVAQIPVERMPLDELDYILESGAQKLGIAFDPLTRARITKDSDGFPYYTHLYALHTIRHTLRDKKNTVDLVDFEESLGTIVSECQLELKKSIRMPLKPAGSSRPGEVFLKPWPRFRRQR